MEEKKVLISWLHPDACADLKLPGYETAGSAGMDIEAAVTEPHLLDCGEIFLVPAGFAVAIPDGYEIQVRPRSGLALKYGITLINSPGTIDQDYRGEIMVPLINLGKAPFLIERGARIAQLVLAPVARAAWKAVSSLPATPRGDGGFGHTGV